MNTVLYRLRAELRQRWPALLGLVVLVGVAGGVVLASATGAQRTATAYDRFLQASNASHALVSPEVISPTTRDQLAAVDGVADLGTVVGFELTPQGDPTSGVGDVLNLASVDGRFGYELDRPNVLAGRMPHREREDEIFVTRRFAQEYGVEPNDRITLGIEADEEESVSPGGGPLGPGLPSYEVTVTGVGELTSSIVPSTDLDALPTTVLPPALTARLLDEAADALAFTDTYAVVLEPGTSVDELVAAIAGAGLELPFVLDRSTEHEVVARAVRPQSTALWAFTIAAGLASVLVVAQAVARQSALDAVDHPALAALGFDRRRLVAVAALRSLIIAAAAGAVATLLAALASDRFPIGPARAAETDPGVAINGALTAAIAVAITVIVVGTAGATSFFIASHPAHVRRSTRTSALARRLAGIGGSAPAVLGIRRAFESGRGRQAVPVKSGLVGGVLAVAAVVLTVTFAANLDALVTEPTRYGQTWDTGIDAQFGPAPARHLVDEYGTHPDVDGIAGLVYGELTIEGQPVPVIGFDELSGELALTVVEGRQPVELGEIALGSTSLEAIGADVGDRVRVEGPSAPQELIVVGRAVFPQLSMGSFTAIGLGTGGVVPGDYLPPVVSLDELPELVAQGELPVDFDPEPYFVGERSYSAVVLKAEPGRAEALIDRVAGEASAAFAYLRVDQRPAAIRNYASVRATPTILALLLTVLGAAMVGHVLVTAVRRRRIELAMCKAVGMSRLDLSRIVGWQATSLAVVAVLVGAPLGAAGGRLAWQLFADDIGVPRDAAIPMAWVLVVIVGTALIANLAAAIPAWHAARLPTAAVLRTE
jgi:hypothetical protein